MRFVFAIFVSLLVFASGASAQRGPEPQRGLEDTTRSCPLVTNDLLKVVATVMGRCDTFCSGCGCKGGPGFRAPASNSGKGQCVGYTNIIAKCGPAPHKAKGCVPECARVVVACAAFGRSKLTEAAKAANIKIEFIESETPDEGSETIPEPAPVAAETNDPALRPSALSSNAAPTR